MGGLKSVGRCGLGIGGVIWCEYSHNCHQMCIKFSLNHRDVGAEIFKNRLAVVATKLSIGVFYVLMPILPLLISVAFLKPRFVLHYWQNNIGNPTLQALVHLIAFEQYNPAVHLTIARK